MTAVQPVPSAWLVHSGHVFADKVFLSESYAKESVTSRNDGSQVSPLYLQPVARTPPSDEAEQAAMYRWLRDHYHGFEHYRSGFAKKQNLFENDIRKQMGITQEKQG